ncbi:hypothetical protein LINPERHAP1_LOCUS37732 [Linum perenne]
MHIFLHYLHILHFYTFFIFTQCIGETFFQLFHIIPIMTKHWRSSEWRIFRQKKRGKRSKKESPKMERKKQNSSVKKSNQGYSLCF